MTERLLKPRSTAVLDARSADGISDTILKHGQVTTGVVDDISADGVARIVLSGDTVSCEAATLLTFPSADAAAEALLGRTVLVLVHAGSQPVILGAVVQRLWDTRGVAHSSEVEASLPEHGQKPVRVDKRQLDFEASQEIRLTCGQSSILLRRDGTVIIRGVKIVSRASQSNKIRGGSISLN